MHWLCWRNNPESEVHVLSWQHAYRDLIPKEFFAALSVEKREAMWRECIVQGSPELLVAKADGRVSGFASFGASRDEEAPSGTAQAQIELARLCVLPLAVGHRLDGGGRPSL